MARTEAEDRVWWQAYSKSIRDRRGSHPTTEAEARSATEAADKAVTEAEIARLWELTPEREYIDSIAGGYFAWAAGVRAARYNAQCEAWYHGQPGCTCTKPTEQ